MKLRYGLLVGLLLSPHVIDAAEGVFLPSGAFLHSKDREGGKELCLEYPLKEDQLPSQKERQKIALLRLQQHNQAPRILKLQPNVLKGFTNLLVLNLSGCQIGAIPEKALHSMVNLQELHMSNCGIKQELYPALFATLAYLRLLDCSHNAIFAVQPGTFKDHEVKLPVYEFDYERDQRLRPGRSLSALKTVDLSDNNITVLEEGQWVGLPELKQLDLRNNPLGKIKLGCLADRLPKLTVAGILLDSWEGERLPRVPGNYNPKEDTRMTPQEFCLLYKPEKSPFNPLPWHITRRNHKD